ncbi:VOC family protein [Streptomyces yaizuensis]|uniref:VOC family protein n=1 Tax=Streptomyces yaizuensis TaxID=2989713 RepID=A0ABQ5P871_9ACTN|nr:VOC family protein [Streptomyces sp. YSPA8]GLF98770.1 VOC family protein [Streptomyces sp. YSPA8]
MEFVLTPPTAPPAPTPDGLAALHHVGITVSDLERSVRWYEEKLGMVQWMKESFPGGRTAGMMRPGTGVHLGLTQHDSGTGEEFAPQRTGLDHLTFAAGSLDELHGWRGHLASLGVECSEVREYKEPIVFALFTFTDPDGVALEVMHIAG